MKRLLRVVVVLASIGGAVWLFLKRSGGGGESGRGTAPVAAPVTSPAAPPDKPAATTDEPAAPVATAADEPAPTVEGKSPAELKSLEGKSPAEVKALAETQPYGPGSASGGSNGEAPEGHTIKGNTGSKLYHTVDSPYYKRTKAEVWFATEEAAQAAGFERWDAKRKK